MKKYLAILLLLAGTAFAANPVLFFSDLDWGPNSGWEGSATKGAAITVWGKNFGATRGASYVTVNGASYPYTVTSIIQEVISRAGWTSGSAIRLDLINTTSVASTALTIFNYDTSPTVAAKLDITWH